MSRNHIASLLATTALVSLVAAGLVTGVPRVARAQQVVANGTTQTASGTINTGVLPPTAGHALYSLNAGVIQSFTPLSLITGGPGSHAAVAESGGSIIIFNGSSITTTGSAATGIVATGAGSAITADNFTLSATGFGAGADDGAVITLNGGTITSVSSALRVGGGTINATNINATATGTNAIGVNANNGTINLTGGSVTAMVGTGDAGINASGASGSVVASGVSVNAIGNGVQAVTNGTVSFSNGTITSRAIGVRAASGGTATIGTNTTVNLSVANTTGVLAESGGTVIFNDSTVATTATTTPNSAGQIGFRATGAGSTINATGSSVRLGPPNMTTVANNMTGAIAEAGAFLNLTDTSVRMFGGTTGLNNHAVVATGPGSTVSFLGGAIETRSRNSYGVFAQDGGVVTLGNAATVTTIGSGTAAIAGSHALYALGSNSVINGTGIVITTTGAIASGARAENGGTINLTGGTVTVSGASVSTAGGSHGLYALGAGSVINATNVTASTSGGSSASASNAARAESGGALFITGGTISTSGSSGADTDPNSAVRVMSGGFAQIMGATLNATGQRGWGLSVQDAGSTATMTNTTVTVAGSRANAVFLFNGGQATVSDSFLTSTGFSAVVLQDAGSSIDLTNTVIRADTLATAIGFGLRTSAGATATMTGGSVSTVGRDSPGLHAGGGNATITATNVVVTTSGNDNAMGVLVDGNALITLNGGSVTTTGNNVRPASFPHALGARNPGGALISTGTTILTTGITAMGAVADDGGTVTLSGNSIRTEGLRSIGLYSITEQVGAQFPANLTATGVALETLGAFAHGAAAQARNDVAVEKATLTLNNSSITTRGGGSVGLRATLADYGTAPATGRGEAAVIANNTFVFTEGLAAHGALSRDNPTSVTMINTTVLATGSNAHGSVAEAGGLIVGNNAIVEARGPAASALFVVGDGGPVSNAQFSNNSRLTNVNGPTIGVAGAGNITLTNSTAGGSGQWLKVGTVGDFTPLAQIEPPLTGIADPDVPPPLPPGAPPVGAPAGTPGLANITLNASTVIGSALTVPGSVSNVTLANNSHWIMTGNSNLTNLINDPSFIEFTPPTGDPTLLGSYKTLTVVNYIGIDGIIGLNTFLGTDGAPSDRLVIDGGTATGHSPLRITNTIGPGALTVSNGILVVDAINGGTTVPGAFTLAGPVVAGPYAYGLFRSSVDASNPQAWYLRSTIDCTLPGAPSPPCGGGGPVPNYRTEVSLYAAIPAMTLLYGRAILDTLHERVGEEEDVRGRANPSNRGPSGAWGRVIGMHGHRDSDSIFGSGPTYTYDFLGFQAGTDLYRHQDADGVRDHAGIYFAFGEALGKVQHFDGSGGDSNFKAFSLGGYWTRFWPSGGYVDAVLQATWYDVTSTANRGVPALKTDGFGIAASLEAGYPFRLDHGYFIEPQAQIVYQDVGLDDSSDVANTIVRFGDVDSLAGRIGARFGRTWNVGTEVDPRQLTAWFRPNLWHEFRGNPRTEFSSADGFIPFRADLGGTWLELNAGLSGQVSQDLSLFGNISYHTRFEGDSHAYTGKLGLRKVW